MADSLLNEQQQKKFEQEWELCISLLHQRRGPGPGDVLPAQRASGDELPLLRRAASPRARNWGCRRRLTTWRASRTAWS